jgi:hypothetical protein
MELTVTHLSHFRVRQAQPLLWCRQFAVNNITHLPG